MKKLIALLLLAALTSCDNGNIPEDPDLDNIDIESLALDPDIEFIFFESNDEQYLFLEERELPGYSNTYIYERDENGGLDQLNINMTNTIKGNFEYNCDIYISGSALHTRSFPYSLGQAAFEHAEIQLLDRVANVSNQFGPEDKYNFVAASLQNRFSMQVTSFRNGILEASFTGTMKTRATGDEQEIAVKNGRLRVKIEQ